MNKRIRSMIDELFSQMKMTAENLALRDELMANALSRYEDAMAQGRSEDEAFAEIAASLEDIHSLLEEMDAAPQQETAQSGEAQQAQAEAQDDAAPQSDLGDALNKAFAALGDFSQAIMPEAKKLYGQMDDVTGGMLGRLGRAARKGMRDAQKTAGEVIDKYAAENGELIFDFGANREAEQDEPCEAEWETRPENARESAPEEFVSQFETPDSPQEQPVQEAPYVQPDGGIDEDAFAREVEELTRDAQEAIHQAEKMAQEDASDHASDHAGAGDDRGEATGSVRRFPAAGLRRIDVQLDADDIEIVPGEGMQIETLWEAGSADGEPAIAYDHHTLTICRKNPDVFKTFFSVFKKEGGRITVRVPRGFAADIEVSTTSGDVCLREIDADNVKISTTSGSVRIEPDVHARAKEIEATTVSGHVTVRACADTICVTTVSGGQYIDCDAHRVDVNVVSGKVHVEGACDEWDISTVSGETELLCRAVPTKSVEISSVHSDAYLALPGEIRGFTVEANGALGCEIINDFGPNRYGTCSLPIRMDTMHGRLHITRL